jgi:hypothetical protein
VKILSNTEYNKLLEDKLALEKLTQGLSLENAVIKTRNEGLRETNKRLSDEIEFYKESVDRERNRADRAVDSLAQVGASQVLPISDLGLERHQAKEDKDEEALKKQLSELNSIYTDVVGSIMSGEDGI